MALVNELVKLHGGSTTVESTEGKGSTFRVRIPLGTKSVNVNSQQVSKRLINQQRVSNFLEEYTIGSNVVASHLPADVSLFFL